MKCIFSLSQYAANDNLDELARKVLREIDFKRACILQLAPCMHGKSILTDDDHARLVSPHVTDMQRRNLLREIAMQKCTVGWLLIFGQCLLESYVRERSLGSHYKLFQQIKQQGMCITLSGNISHFHHFFLHRNVCAEMH